MSQFDPDFEEDSNEGIDESQPTAVYKCKELLHEKLQSSGQKDLLKRMIQNRLAETGFTYRLRSEFIEYIKRRGSNHVNVSHMIEDVHPIGKAIVPDELKIELRAFLLDFAKTHLDTDESVPRPTEAEVTFSNRPMDFHYQSRDVVPDPGIGVGTSSTDNNSSGSSAASGSGGSTYSSSAVSEEGGSPRSSSSTPPPSEIPFLIPENMAHLGGHPESGSDDDQERDTEEEEIEGDGEDEDDTERMDENEGNEGYAEDEDRQYVHRDRTDFKVDFSEGVFYGDGEDVMIGEIKLEQEGYEVEHGESSGVMYSTRPTNNDDEDDEDFILSTV